MAYLAEPLVPREERTMGFIQKSKWFLQINIYIRKLVVVFH